MLFLCTPSFQQLRHEAKVTGLLTPRIVGMKKAANGWVSTIDGCKVPD